MFAKAKAAASAAALAAKQAAEEADRRYGISDAVAGATEQAAASVAERVDMDSKKAFLTEGVARVTEQAASVAEQAASVAERVDMDSKKAFLTDGVAMVTNKATAFIEDSLADTCDLCYCTRRLVTMPMPGPPPNTLQRLARELHAAHGTHFMVWNLSEVSYDYSTFHDQVLEFRFPGHPAPPLELLVRICNSVENWLAADAENVAVVHCRTGKRRTCTVVACLMAWLGAASDPLQALQVVAQRRGIPISSLTIPSQRRYIRYFDRVLHGDKPSLLSKRLQRIIVNTIPNLCAGDDPVLEQSEGVSSRGCSVEVQLLQNADLELTADVVLRCSHMRGASSDDQLNLETAGTLSKSASSGSSGAREARQADADGPGDQSATRSGDGDEGPASAGVSSVGKFDRIPMWRTAFNVGYVQAGMLRLTREELDGIAPNDTRYDPDFFVDVIFHDDDDDEGDSSTSARLGSEVVDQPLPMSSIWQHVDQRTAHAAAGGRRSAEPIDLTESGSALESNVAPDSTARSAESANFSIDFDDSGGTTGMDDAESAHDPAAQWLGKVQAFEASEASTDVSPGDNGNTATQRHMLAASDNDDATGDELPVQPSASTVIAAVDTETEDQIEVAPRTSASQQESSSTAQTAVSAAVAAAVAAADEANAKKAARTEAMAPATAPAEKSHTEISPAGLQGAALEASGPSSNGTTPSTEKSLRTTSDDSFDNWLEDDVGKSESSRTDNLVEKAAPVSTRAPDVPDAKAASDDLEDFMASLDDL